MISSGKNQIWRQLLNMFKIRVSSGMHVGKFLLYTTIGAGVWNTVLAAIGWGIYEYTDYKTTHDVYQQAVQYSHEIGYVILALAVVVGAFIAYKGIKKK
jgi:membrane protein DedA with SNARE-associated domain